MSKNLQIIIRQALQGRQGVSWSGSHQRAPTGCSMLERRQLTGGKEIVKVKEGDPKGKKLCGSDKGGWIRIEMMTGRIYRGVVGVP